MEGMDGNVKHGSNINRTSQHGAGQSLQEQSGAIAETKPPLLEDVMQLSRLGDVAAVRELFALGKVGADYKDKDGITPLHWAAINNHYAMCKFLVESGADINAKGGDAVATPAMWAAQRCHYYVVNLLLQSGADPLLTDAQGYNILHLATFDGNLFLLILLLHQNIPIDTPDLQGHTCLMWAAYKGYPACVDLFLRWGASVSAKDEQGFAALHWSLVKGSPGCIQKIIEYGADRFAKTSDGKDPHTVAIEMKSVRMWERALQDCGYDSDGNAKIFPFPFLAFLLQPTNLQRFYFLLPFVMIFVVLYVLSSVVIYAAIPIAVLFVYSVQLAAQRMLEWAPPDLHVINKTPYLAGIFAATCFWVGFRWLTKILPSTFQTHPFTNALFALSITSVSYFYFMSMVEDPGFVPKLGSRSQQKAVIEELLSIWKFDDQNFCTQCMVRAPLRSKHCKRCKRCVAKHDHHCPWIHNCVGANNLRHFFIYILSLEIGILLFIRLVLYHLEAATPVTGTQCNILAEAICAVVLRDPFTFALSIWAALQLTWVTMLLFVQCVQISKATTTYESMRGHSDHNSHAGEVLTAVITSGSTSMEGAQLPRGQTSSDHVHAHKAGCFAQWKKLLGLDTFVATAQSGLDGGRARRAGNPYSRGVVTNCRDFWCDPAPIFGHRQLGEAMLDGEVVNYARMYELPPRMKTAPGSRVEQGLYQSVEGEDAV